MNKNKRKSLHFLIITYVFLLIFAANLPAKNVSAATKNNSYILLVNSLTSDVAAKNDITIMKTVFKRNQLPAYNGGKKFKYFFYNTAKKGTSQKVFRKSIKAAYKKAKKNDVAYFFYTGHSIETTSHKALGFALTKRKYYPYKDLAKDLAKNIKCKRIICVVNSCYARAFITKGIAKLSKKDAARFIVYASSGEKQTSLVLDHLCSRYVMNFLEALARSDYGTLNCDYNKDGKITTNELQKYVYNKSRQDKKKFSDWPTQTPYCYRKKNVVVYQY